MGTHSRVERQPMMEKTVRPGFERFWESLVRPGSRIASPQTRTNSRLLAIMMLVGLVLGSGLILYYIVRNPASIDDPDAVMAMIVWGIVLAAYFINRAGNFTLAAGIFVSTLLILFATAPYVPSGRASLAYFAAVAVLMAAIFFSPRYVILNALLSVIISIVTASIFRTRTSDQLMDVFLYLAFASGFIVVFMNHTRRLENIRRVELEEMNRLLRESEAFLEVRVKERTRDLKVASDVSRQTTTVLELDELLPHLANLTQNSFALYAVSVFLYDKTTDTLKLAVSTDDAGRQMMVDAKRFSLGDRVGLVPRAAREREVVVVNDTAAEPAYFANPLRPDTRAEMALPMQVGSKLIGVLDLQDSRPGRFTDEDLEIMGMLAEQIAIAVRNAQLFNEAAEARAAAEQANETKSRFLANMSHELRTPLNAILNFTAFVADGVLGPVTVEQQEALSQSITSSKHLLSLINDVLDITKIESGMMDLFIQEVDFNEILTSTVSVGKGLVKDKPIDLVADVDPDLPISFGDKRRLRQVFLNLISNAVKFTPEGTISITARGSRAGIEVVIRDTGIGIAPEEHHLVFESFKQAKHDLSGSVGTGLGMPISRYFVESHGGRIWFESAPGAGTTFYVELPILQREQAEAFNRQIV